MSRSHSVSSPALRLLLLALAAAPLMACSPPWTVIKTSGPPSTLANAGPVTVAFDYSKLQVGGMNEQAFVASKKEKEPNYEQDWAKLKASFEDGVLGGLGQTWSRGVARGTPGQGVGLVVYPTELSMGHYMVVASTNTSVSTMLDWSVNGQVTETIQVAGSQPATLYTPSVFQHIPPIGSHIGNLAGRYLGKRQ
jgi:hypothetical protein